MFYFISQIEIEKLDTYIILFLCTQGHSLRNPKLYVKS